MKKFISAILSVMLLAFEISIISTAVEDTKFSDISGSEYYAEAVKDLADRKIITGYEDNTFGAEKFVTRAEMAVIVCRLLNIEEYAEKKSENSIFIDVPKDYWASGYINLLANRKVVNGDGSGNFRPTDNVLYEEAIKMIVCALGMDRFIAADALNWAKPYIEFAEEKGITNSLKGVPGEPVTRGDIVMIVFQGMNNSWEIVADNISEFDNGKANNYIHYENDYLYTGGYGGYLSKIDVTKGAERIVKEKWVTKKLGCNGIEVFGDYLYTVWRDTTAGLDSARDGRNPGEFIICKKDDLSIVNTMVLDWKASRVKCHKNLCVVALQMKGWNLYTAEDAENPKLVYSHRESLEYQSIDFFEVDNRCYVVFGGYGSGIFIYDVTDTNNVTVAGEMKFWWFEELKSRGHVYDVKVEYPYLYATYASKKSFWDSEKDLRGVMVVDISNMKEWNMNNTDSINYYIADIKQSDKITKDEWENGDEMPTKLIKYDNYIITNTGGPYLAVFDASEPTNVQYINTIRVPSENYIGALSILDDGRIITAVKNDNTGGVIYSFNIN